MADSAILTAAVNAALANGMLAHADETDDSHKDSRCHPGCGVVPVALVMAEKEGRSGEALLRAMVLGYDVCCRITPALGVDPFYEAGHSTHSFAPLFGAAAAGALAGLDEEQIPWLISYTAQQASGVNCWQRDKDHIEKAFDFGGMPARDGVTAATMVAAEFTGVADVFSGPRNFFSAFSSNPKPELLTEDLGKRFEIMETNIKKWSVGSPIQAALDSLEFLIRDNGLKPDQIDRISVRMSDKESHVVDDRNMPDINLQHLLALLAVDGTLTFASSHDGERMNDPAVAEVRNKVALIPDSGLPRRRPIIRNRDGRWPNDVSRHPRGPGNARKPDAAGGGGEKGDRPDGAYSRGFEEPGIGRYGVGHGAGKGSARNSRPLDGVNFPNLRGAGNRFDTGFGPHFHRYSHIWSYFPFLIPLQNAVSLQEIYFDI